MKICLVRPFFPNPKIEPSLTRPPVPCIDANPYPPFGLLQIASYLEGHKVILCDMQMPHWTIPEDVDAYLISVFSSQLTITHDIISEIKTTINPKAKFIVGGPAITYNLNQAIKHIPNADIIYAGEGEHFALNFDKYINSSEQVVKCPQLYNWNPHRMARWGIGDYEFYASHRGFAVETSRGCCFNCVFCTSSLIFGKKWRPRKPLDVVDELTRLKKQYGAKKVHFTDDNATVDPERWYYLMWQIAEAKLGLKIIVPEGIQAHHLDRETLKAMKAAGLTEFTIGAESGTQRVLDEVIDKGGLTVEKIEQVVRDAVSLGMKPSCFFVIGIAGETLAEAEETVRFAEKLRKLGAENCNIRNSIPMPGTRQLQIAKEKGYLTVPEEQLENFDYVHTGKHLMITPEWTPKQIESLVAKAQIQNLQHIARFHNLIRHPRSTLKLRRRLRRDFNV